MHIYCHHMLNGITSCWHHFWPSAGIMDAIWPIVWITPLPLRKSVRVSMRRVVGLKMGLRNQSYRPVETWVAPLWEPEIYLGEGDKHLLHFDSHFDCSYRTQAVQNWAVRDKSQRPCSLLRDLGSIILSQPTLTHRILVGINGGEGFLEAPWKPDKRKGECKQDLGSHFPI